MLDFNLRFRSQWIVSYYREQVKLCLIHNDTKKHNIMIMFSPTAVM